YAPGFTGLRGFRNTPKNQFRGLAVLDRVVSRRFVLLGEGIAANDHVIMSRRLEMCGRSPTVADAWLAELTLDRTSGVPLYVQLREALRRIINSGVLPNGACLPSETELSKTLHISRMTVRNALT